ncbi:MAG: cysteine desulfurase NifS [Candidatus Magasanikbacteria bacterium]|nr:cysteine desulfurase NifS [Candidatus Magasanikbacteria bacterium]
MPALRHVYLDHAATTPVRAEVLSAMLPYFSDEAGNPGGLYADGRRAGVAVSSARDRIAKILNCRNEEIIFTGSGTESDNLAIFGIARAYKNKGQHLVASPIEHHAVINPMEQLKREGFALTYTEIDASGRVGAKEIIPKLREDTLLVSIMYANNEIGAIEPVAEIGKAIREWKRSRGRTPLDPPFFHTDACQAVGVLDIDVQALQVDLLTLNGSKIYGPKGIGALYRKRGVKVQPIIFGGGQEFRLRSGTENVPYIVGLATALELAQEEKEKENARLITLRDYFIAELHKRIPKIALNGHPQERLPNNINVSILDIEGEALLLYLDEAGIAASTGSACTSESLDPSHVIVACGRPYEFAHGSMRFTLGRSTTYVLDVLPPIVEKLRAISPVHLDLDADADQIARREAFVSDGVPHWMANNNQAIHRQ